MRYTVDKFEDPATMTDADFPRAGGTRPTTVASSATCARATASCSDGQRGMCFVRQRVGDEMVLTTYGRSSGFCVDPIEKKPLNHFYPGTSVLSFGTAGCNLACKFCQNWDISKSREMDRLVDQASARRHRARRASDAGAASVAFTYNDPTIFAEYAMDIADACHALGIQTVAVTAGYIYAEPRRELYAKIDAANVDLKAFTDDFYQQGHRVAHLEPVKDTLRYLVRETKVWTEITTLIIPALNDSDAELTAARRVRRRRPRPRRAAALHRVPSRLQDARHPADAARDAAPRPRDRARAGLRYVYTGNVHDREGDTTLLPVAAATPVIERDWYEILGTNLHRTARAASCGTRDRGPLRRAGRHLRPQAHARRRLRFTDRRPRPRNRRPRTPATSSKASGWLEGGSQAAPYVIRVVEAAATLQSGWSRATAQVCPAK